MDIVRLIKEAHQNAIDKGFYDCHECDGEGYYGSQPIQTCSTCKGSKIDPNKNIGELLMLIVSELGEALEAHRNRRFCDQKEFDRYLRLYKELKEEDCEIPVFEAKIKDTFEDEIADVFIRLFDLCGYLDLSNVTLNEIIRHHDIRWHSDNIGDCFYRITQILSKIRHSEKQNLRTYMIANSIAHLWNLCKKHNIPIEKHITAKMAYNKTREHKHGKAY